MTAPSAVAEARAEMRRRTRPHAGVSEARVSEALDALIAAARAEGAAEERTRTGSASAIRATYEDQLLAHIGRAKAEGRAEGRAEMREEAARACDSLSLVPDDDSEECARVIRALPTVKP